MIVKEKTKRRLIVALISVMVAVILCGITIGVVLFIHDKSGNKGLTRAQVAFAKTLASYRDKATASDIDLPSFGELSDSELVCVSESYVAFKVQGKEQIFDRKTGAKVELDLSYVSLENIFGKLALFETGSGRVLYDLEHKKVLASFGAGTATYSSGYVMIVSASLEMENRNLQAVILSAVSGSAVLSVEESDDAVELVLDSHFAIFTTKNFTKVFALDSNFTNILSYENSAENNSSSYNVESALTKKKYLFGVYHKVSELSREVLLVERVEETGLENYDISMEIGEQKKFYKISYNLFDTYTSTVKTLQSEGEVISREIADFADNYIALVRTKIENKSELSQTDKRITYYVVDKSKAPIKFSITKVLSYDYEKFGRVVGIKDNKLLTFGGNSSGVIDFKGLEDDKVLSSSKEKATSSNFSGGYFVYSSLGGMKGVKDSKGNVVFKAEYEKISPIENGAMLAVKGGEYYLLSVDKFSIKIQNFAREFEDFVFAGIGYYFTKNSDSSYNVYDLSRKLIKSAASVSLIINQDKSVSLFFGNDAMKQIVPINAVAENAKTADSELGIFFSNAKKAVFSENRVATGESLTALSLDEDEVTGAANKFYSGKITSQDLNRMLGYDELTSEQQALIPAFDDAQAKSYIESADGANITYSFNGAMFFSDENVIMGIIKLKSSKEPDNPYFVVVLALRNAYLLEAEFKSDTESGLQTLSWFDRDGKKQSRALGESYSFGPNTFINGLAIGSESAPSESRALEISASGYDMAAVFTSKASKLSSSQSLNYSFKISNVFLSASQISGELLDAEGETVLERDEYTLRVVYNEQGEKILVLQAKEGYLFKSANFMSYSNTSPLRNEDKRLVYALSETATVVEVNFSQALGTHFAIENIEIIEWYKTLVLKDIEGSEAEPKQYYYFYGYPKNLGAERNPTPLGFKNFEKIKAAAAFSQVGYDFAGYTFTDGFKVIDASGVFVAGSNIIEQTLELRNIVLSAIYTPKSYNISYKVGGTLLTETSSALFNQKIGSLLDASQYIPTGYVFAGWYYANTLIDEDSIYEYSQGITLEARLTAKEYTLNLNLNKENYSSQTHGGYSYDIGHIFLASDFGGGLIGDSVTSALSKKIYYNSTYGDLPVLRAVSIAGEEYIFLGWFDRAEVMEEDGLFTYGNRLTSETKVESDPPILELYAHFARRVLGSSIKVEGENSVIVNDKVVNNLASIDYEGSSAAGFYGKFSTAQKEGYSSFDKADGLYNIYSVYGETLKTTFFVNEGYYISKISLKIYSDLGAYEYNLIGQFDSKTKTYTLSGDASDIKVLVDGFNVSLVAESCSSFKEQNGKSVFMEIVATLEGMRFDNSFTLQGENTQIKKGESVLSGDDLGNLFAAELVYEILADKKNTPMGTFSTSYLSSITIDDITIHFEREYKKVSDIYAEVLVGDIEKLSSLEDENKIVESYSLADAILRLEYDKKLKSYSYFLLLTATANHSILIQTEKAAYDLDFNLINSSSDNSKQVGALAKIIKWGVPVSTSEETSGTYSAKALNPSDVLNIEIELDRGFLFARNSAVTITYNGTLYNISDFVNELLSDKIKINPKFTASLSEFSVSDNVVMMIANGLKFTYIAATNKILIEIYNISRDLSIDLRYEQYVRLDTNALDKDCYEFVGVDANSNERPIKDLAAELSGDFTSAEFGNTQSLLIYRNEDKIHLVRLKALVTESSIYEIRNSRSDSGNGISVDQYATTAEIDRNALSYAYFELVEKTKQLFVDSLLGRKEGEYVTDPILGFDVLSNIVISYYNQDRESVTGSYAGASSKFDFCGTNISIKIYLIKGYVFESANLYITGREEVISPFNEDFMILKTDSSSGESYYEYVYHLDSAIIPSYSFKVESRAVSYTIEYVLPTGVGSEVIGTIEDQKMFYNVFERLADNQLYREGYDFLGYSPDSVSFTDATEDDVHFARGQLLNENLSHVDGAVVKLYAVFVAKEFEIDYMRNALETGNGSSPAVLIQGEMSVKFDHAFNTLSNVTRKGYEFLGWFTSLEQDGVKVQSSDVLNSELFAKIKDKTQNKITLYAKYEAITYSVNIDLNDASLGYGSTNAEGLVSNLKVTFDQPFVLPTLSRFGYNFMGYKTKRFSSEAAKLDNLKYIGVGPDGNTISVLNYDIVDSEGEYKLTISDANKVLTLYAVYIAKTFKAYINLNNSALKGYGTDEFIFDIVYGDETSSYMTEYTTYFFDVNFDSDFSAIPTVESVGYNFVGLFTTREFDLSSQLEGGVNADTVLDKTLFDKLSYKDLDGNITKLTQEGGKFSLFAHYTYKDFRAALAKSDKLDKFNISKMNNYLDYELAMVMQNSNLSYGYLEDIVFDMFTEEGKYISKLTISASASGRIFNQELVFEFNSALKMLTINGKGPENGIFQVINATKYLFDGVYIKILPYNENGSNSQDISSNTARILLFFDNARSDIDIEVSAVSVQTFEVSYFAYSSETNGPKLLNEKVETKLVEYGSELLSDELIYAYMAGFKFIDYRIAANSHDFSAIDTAPLASEGMRITSNLNLVARYTVAKRQEVNFYVYDNILKSYVKRPVSQDYVLYYFDELTGEWISGAYDKQNYDLDGTKNGQIWALGGKLLTLPSKGSEIWPENSYLVSYVIAASAPEGGKYYSFLDNQNAVNAKTLGLKSFDTSVMVEDSINVYAVYNEPLFETKASFAGDQTQISVSSDYALYQEFNGIIYELQNRDIFFVELSATQLERFMLQLSKGDTIEVALITAIGDISNVMGGTDSGSFVFDANEGSSFIALTLSVDENGMQYISRVAESYVTISGGTISETYITKD